MKKIKRILLFVLFLSVLAVPALLWLNDHYTVPVVMYHKVESLEQGRADTVSPQRLRYHLDYMKTKGYSVLSLEDYVEGVRTGRKFDHKSVVLTFDDGYDNNWSNAFPILKEFGYPAAIFIPSEQMGQPGYLPWEQVKEMADSGITFGSHGLTEAYLPDCPAPRMKREIEDSKRIIEEEIGSPVNFIAYPIGGFNDGIKAQVKRTGYFAAMATNRGNDRFNQDLYEINRIKFSDKDDSDLILWAKLSGYYNLFRKLKKPY